MGNLGNVRTIIAGSNDTSARIAQRVTGCSCNWQELVRVNPHKRTTMLGDFRYIADGERLVMPLHWPQPAGTGFLRSPTEGSGRGRFEAGALPNVTLPNGWTDDDLKTVMVMAPDLGVGDPKALLAVWGSETGIGKSAQMSPRTAYRVNGIAVAGGLNGSTESTVKALGFASVDAWLNAGVRVQLQGIYQQYLVQVRRLGEGFESRASRLGTTTAALIYGLNFLPAIVSGLRTRTQAMCFAGQTYYDSNRILDVGKKGYINLADFEYWTRPERFPSDWPLPILTARLDAIRSDPQEVAALESSRTSVWDAARNVWQSLTGRGTVETPPAPPNSPRYTTGGPSMLGTNTAEGYTAATGLVLAGIFVVAWHQGWLNRLAGR